MICCVLAFAISQSSSKHHKLHKIDSKSGQAMPPAMPYYPPLQQDIWSSTLNQYVDWIDTIIIPDALKYTSYWGMD